jgi:hypothetical protein
MPKIRVTLKQSYRSHATKALHSHAAPSSLPSVVAVGSSDGFVYPAYISFQKYKWAHFTRKEFFSFSQEHHTFFGQPTFSSNNGGRLYYKLIGHL